jgi:hypothetical protein
MLSLDDGMMDRAHFYSDEAIKSNEMVCSLSLWERVRERV